MKNMKTNLRLLLTYSITLAFMLAISILGIVASVKTSTLSLIIIVTLTVLGFAISIILALFITKTITKPINKIIKAASSIADGNIDINLDIDSTDEIGILAQSLKRAAGAIKVMSSDVGILAEAVKNGKLDARADASKHSGEYRKIIEGFNDTLRAIITPIDESISVLKRVAVSDLTVKIEGTYKGEMKVLSETVNSTIDHTIAIQNVFEDLSKGDFSHLPELEKIGKRSENDKMMPSAIKVMHTLNMLIEGINKVSMEAVNGNLKARGDASKYEGKYNQLVNGIHNIMDAIETPFKEAIDVLKTMATNDFTSGMRDDYKGDFANLSMSVNSVLETLNQMLSDISAASEQVAAGTQQVSAGSQALSQGATEQASAVEQLTASLNEIAGDTKQNAVNANQASDLAVAARDNAAEGNSQMKELQQAMNEINESSGNISKIIKVIDEIAFQTNLLALNAAVEAARAGQHGKGFAVVAEEVRNLAQRSASAAKETTEMIEGSINKVQTGTKLANETADALTRIVAGVEKVTALVGGIAKASDDQATAVSQVNSGIEQVSQVVQSNSATAEESAAASEELTSQAVLLKEMVGRFTLRGQSAAVVQKAAFQHKSAAKALPEGKFATGKPKISLNDRDFGKY